ncbi:MAG TPA: hypothetical protein PK052_04425 [Anaerohalosphaeraceae bacterium]|nr:hypothetical protein [Anaerohalosphaeraceae bacterium]HOL31206.1 hypothetical protein [Anaerohalosphaeraceae bacterium]HOM75455.1 hypothetical protein [Anaerohalosphaeraceae bacterium]HPC63817.1 hypothetical protein [Anaerohalosphaeraceae bacterium]HPO69508.1 hypothetical protein [Anaerohalosphaeraceae bacterium]
MNRKTPSLARKIQTPASLQNISPKMMVMVVLLAVMGILWGRVLLGGKKGPAVAEAQQAAVSAAELQSVQSAPAIRINPVELPCRLGRNDQLTNDLFSRKGFLSAGAQSSSRDSTADKQSRLERLATAQLTLEAVVRREDGTPYQAFVNGKIVTVGAMLTVNEGPDQYVLTVTDIKENRVELEWNTVSVVLKMTGTSNQ